MNYKFPFIENITDVLPAIEGRDEFVVSEKEDATYINYVVIKPDTFKIVDGDIFNSYIRRECRGISFNNSNGVILSRPFHKFFNLNERECSLDSVVMKKMTTNGYNFYDKKDGSMVRPTFMNDQILFATKMGITDVANEVNTLLHNNCLFDENSSHYTFRDIIGECMVSGYTPIFEYISPTNQIVLKYNRPQLVFLAMRNNRTGEYVSSETETYGWKFLENMKCDDHLNTLANAGTGLKLHESVEYLRGMENSEGAVLRFDDGHMVKIKSDWYVRLHKTKDAISSDRKIVDLIINQGVDDLMPILMKEDKANVLDIQDWFWHVYDQKVNNIQHLYNEMRTKYGDDRGAFAREQMSQLHPLDGRLIFSLWDGKDAGQVLMNMIQGHLSTERKWDEMSDFLNL